MNSVIFGFSKPVRFNILSELIEKIEKRPYSHVYMRFKDPTTQKDVVFQASGLCVNICLFDTFKEEHVAVEEYEFPLKGDESLVFWNYVLSKLGTAYSVLQLVYILVNKIFHVHIGDSSGEICSELAAQVSVLLGLPVPGDLEYVTPSDFNKFCNQNMQRVL